MDAKTWDECKRIFAEVFAAPAVERESVLTERCGGRVEILDEVRELLLVADRADRRLDGPPWTTPSDGGSTSASGSAATDG